MNRFVNAASAVAHLKTNGFVASTELGRWVKGDMVARIKRIALGKPEVSVTVEERKG